MDKLRVGILGLGRGLTHLKNFLAIEEAEVIGACDRIPRLRGRAREQLAAAGANAPLLEEFDELLALGPEAIMVASNGKVQVEHACRALAALLLDVVAHARGERAVGVAEVIAAAEMGEVGAIG